jgi:hypothetical protein
MKVITMASCFFPLFAAALGFVSCKGDGADTVPPTIALSLPADNQVYTNGQTINIKGVLKDSDLHAATITITNDAGGAALYNTYLSIHGTSSYNVNENWVSAVTSVTNATLKVEAVDYSGNKAERKVPVKITL